MDGSELVLKTMKLPISAMLPEEINSALKCVTRYRGEQIFKAIHNGITDFNMMTNLPADLKKNLCENFSVISSSSLKTVKDSSGNAKITVTLEDKNKIECVALSDGKGRKTACLSTQAGCAMGCLFCKTGSSGFFRNLTAAEIVEQFILLEAEGISRISNIVFMGMGEPLENCENLFKAAAVLNCKKGSNISYRKMTLSTCGLADKIYFIADNAPPLRLAVSLNCADQKKREKIMPIAKKFPLDELKKSLGYYQNKQKKRITLEYILIKDFNTTKEDVLQIKKFTTGLSVLLNVIPWNVVNGLEFKPPSAKEVKDFCYCVESLGINYSVRHKKGETIDGACGQLAAAEN